jgi:ABC-type amino acid transport substrate-binding protein
VRARAPNWTSAYSEERHFDLYEDSIDRIKSLHELTVAVHSDYSDGFFCFDSKMTPGTYEGFDIDLIDLIGKELKAKYELSELRVNPVFVRWPEIIERPNTFDVDFSIASISITTDRQRRVEFSVPYTSTELSIVQPSSAVINPTSLVMANELVGLRVGLHKGTNR